IRQTPQVPLLKKSLTAVTIGSSSQNKLHSRGMTTGNDNLVLPKALPSLPSSSESLIYLRLQKSDDKSICNKNACKKLAAEYAHSLESIVKTGSSSQDQNGKDDDDVSIAGTIFSKPWDFNVWENLLDLAHYGDEKPSTLTRNHDTNQIVLGYFLFL
ncbi:unnamed protein product, partial [Onchocerca ochengi]|uniref:DUSP domain-containing protein n=1 Tax=Onchocerca ochengi TaxID=42157 RepID=A0A182EU34_ONCOC